MSWFKSLVMRQNSPTLLIDPSSSSSSSGSRHKMKIARQVGAPNPAAASRLKNSTTMEPTLSSSASRTTRVLESESSQATSRQAQVRRGRTRRSEAPNCAEKCLAQSTSQQPFEREALTEKTNHHNSPQLVHQHSVLSSLSLSSAAAAQEIANSSPVTSHTSSNQRAKAAVTTTRSATPTDERDGEMKTHDHQKLSVRRRRSGGVNLRCHESPSLPMMTGSPLLVWLAGFVILVSCLPLMFGSQAFAQAHQSFEAQPEQQYSVESGREIRLRCLIRQRLGECLWLRNGRALSFIAKKYHYSKSPDDGDCSLMIKNATVQNDDGLWQCQVTNTELDHDNSLQSRESQLMVLVAPERPQIKNTTQSTHRVILEENKTKFIVCEMRGGNPAPQIEWLLDGKNITKEAQTSSFFAPSATTQSSAAKASNLGPNPADRITQSKLRMSDIKRSMNGKNLTCLGVHQTGSQAASAELDVQYVPTVSVVQREYSIVEGSPLSISCQVDANPPPNIVNWRLVTDNSGLSGRQSSSAAITQPTRPGPVLEFEHISRDLNQNVFECLAQNSYGISLPADVKLNVLYAPFLVNTSHSESVSLGSQAHLACIFDGNPEPEVKWLYSDPLSRSAVSVQLETSRQQQQYLTIKNVTYRNEGDYHCEARNQIHGASYSMRSSNIALDVFGEPQFLVKSPMHAKAVQGSKSDMALTFCADPPPTKVHWQFGSIRLDVRLNNINNGQQPVPSVSGQAALPGGHSKQHSMSQRFQVHPLSPIQRRDSNFSKVPTCFEAQLTILDPELTDQRDYTLVVQNERGHQTALVRLRVTSPLSPVLMITSAFVTICGLFLCSLIVMFLLKKRHDRSAASGSTNGNRNGLSNGGITRIQEKNGVEHLANGNGLAATAVAAAAAAAAAHAAAAASGHQQQLMQQQTRGIVNGAGSGMANGASNPTGAATTPASLEAESASNKAHHLMSLASSDTSGDQKQLLSDRNSSASGSTNTTNQCNDYNANLSNSTGQSTANSSPTPMNHISVDDDLQVGSGSGTYQAAESVTPGPSQLSPRDVHHLSGTSALIYANLDFTDHHHPQQQQLASNLNSVQQQQAAPFGHQSPNGSNLGADHAHRPVNLHQQQQQHQLAQMSNQSPKLTAGIRSNVGATVAMMNSLAAQNQQQQHHQPMGAAGAGVLNGAINQQLANNRQQVRRVGPPKPPKPSIQQRSRFYQQHVQQQQQQDAGNNGLVMIGQPAGMSGGRSNATGSYHQQAAVSAAATNVGADQAATATDLAVEYSRIAFPARAEL